MLTWLIAIIGWYYFNRFASDTEQKHTSNYQAFRMISRGLGLLIFDLIGIPMISSVRTYWAAHKAFAVDLTVFSNYFHIFIPLLAFGFLFAGSHKLVRSSRYAIALRSKMFPTFAASLLFISLFTIAVFVNTSRQVAPGPGTYASYYVSDPMIVLTIIIPLGISWVLGLQAALNTEQYVHALAQPKWRKAINHFFHGLLAIVSSSIILQAITAFGSEQLQQVGLALILVVIYLFIIVQAIGYLFIRASAKQLHHLIKIGAPREID
ncbi:MAG TPA: hypothetical protein VLG25_00540 [Patescibacteria group bacterium]|nr:hypothetical protein [Patescibacteria group bacterium]